MPVEEVNPRLAVAAGDEDADSLGRIAPEDPCLIELAVELCEPLLDCGAVAVEDDDEPP